MVPAVLIVSLSNLFQLTALGERKPHAFFPSFSVSCGRMRCLRRVAIETSTRELLLGHVFSLLSPRQYFLRDLIIHLQLQQNLRDRNARPAGLIRNKKGHLLEIGYCD